MSIERGNTLVSPDPEKNEADMSCMMRIALVGYAGISVSTLIYYLSSNPSYECPAGVAVGFSAAFAGVGTVGAIIHKKAVVSVAKEMTNNGNDDINRGTALVNRGRFKVGLAQQHLEAVGSKKEFNK